MRAAAIALALTLAALPALAQQPMPDPIEAALAQQWQAAQTMQQNAAHAITRLIEDRAALKARVAELEKLCGETCKKPE